MTRPQAHRTRRGFTLVELMIVVALVAIILAMAAPSFTRMIEMQRLRGTQTQLVTDLQFARSEAIARNVVMRVIFTNTAAMSCYTIYTAPTVQGGQGPCNCTLGPGNACTGMANRNEVRTVQVAAGSGVTVKPPGPRDRFGFDPTTGGLVSNPNDEGPVAIDNFRVDVFLDNERSLRALIERSGRPTVCAPASSTMPEAACPL